MSNPFQHTPAAQGSAPSAGLSTRERVLQHLPQLVGVGVAPAALGFAAEVLAGPPLGPLLGRVVVGLSAASCASYALRRLEHGDRASVWAAALDSIELVGPRQQLALWVLLGLVAGVVPGLWWMVGWTVAWPVWVLERRGLDRAAELTRGHRGRAAVTLLVAASPTVLVTFATADRVVLDVADGLASIWWVVVVYDLWRRSAAEAP